MTINNRRLYRILDSATRNDFLGEDFGALHLGKENCTPGISGSQGNFRKSGDRRDVPEFRRNPGTDGTFPNFCMAS